VNEGNIKNFLPQFNEFILAAIRSSNDEICGRFASGLVSDLSNYLEKEIAGYAPQYMESFHNILITNEYTTETKLHAMIAVGDLCLAIEENFQAYLE
jgi:hypothetical protein